MSEGSADPRKGQGRAMDAGCCVTITRCNAHPKICREPARFPPEARPRQDGRLKAAKVPMQNY